MPIIDADTHVDETEDTWAYLGENELQFKPEAASPPNLDPSRPPSRYWIIDGHRQPRATRDDVKTGTTVEVRELLDVGARVRQMDELRIDVQVIYPTMFLVGITQRPEIEVAIKRSYNRWLADRTDRSGGRLCWACLPPTTDMDAAVKELRFARDHGACAVLKKGDLEADKWPSDPYFFPLYEEAQRLDMAVCFHTGSGTPAFPSAREQSLGRFMRSGLPPVAAFNTLIFHDIPSRFPTLRFGFLEATSSWIPYVLYDLYRRTAHARGEKARGFGPELMGDVMKKNRMYVALQVDEDLPSILRYAGEDNLILGSDYGHSDAAVEREFQGLMQVRVDQGDLSRSAASKIMYDNAKALYGL